MIDSNALKAAVARVNSAGIQPSSSSGAGSSSRYRKGSRDNPWSWWEKETAGEGDYVYDRPDSMGLGNSPIASERFANLDSLIKAYQGGARPSIGTTTAGPSSSLPVADPSPNTTSATGLPGGPRIQLPSVWSGGGGIGRMRPMFEREQSTYSVGPVQTDYEGDPRNRLAQLRAQANGRRGL